MQAVSVIVPVYKVEKYIKRCVNSILSQTFKDFELILVDDGSPDNCGAICDEYALKDNRIHVIHQNNRGLSAARNAGIDWAFMNSDTQWLTFIDSDDWVHEQYLEALYSAAIQNNTAISACAFEETDGDLIYVNSNQLKGQIWDPDHFYSRYNVYATIACAKLYKKECFYDIRYPEGKIHEDEFVTYKILFPCKEITFIEAPLYAYFVNSNGITKSVWTPNKLLSIQAAEEQLNYFRVNGFKAAWKRRIESYVCVIAKQIKDLNDCSIDLQKQYKGKLKKKLKKALFKYRKQISFNENQWIFEQAYPCLMSVYWILTAQLAKFRRR